MSEKRSIKKRYLITVASIFLAVFSVLFLRFFNLNYEKQKILIKKDIDAIFEFNKDFIDEIFNGKSEEKAKTLRDSFASKISYIKLLDDRSDFKNFKYLPEGEIYGMKLLNNAHLGFYYNTDCDNAIKKKSYCADILLDVNGYTKPNQLGKDQFLFKISKNGIIE